MELLFDIETDNLYEYVTKIHCIVTKDINNGSIKRFTSAEDIHPTIEDGLSWLQGADRLIGHNIIDFDIPVIHKLYDDWRFNLQVTELCWGAEITV